MSNTNDADTLIAAYATAAQCEDAATAKRRAAEQAHEAAAQALRLVKADLWAWGVSGAVPIQMARPAPYAPVDVLVVRITKTRIHTVENGSDRPTDWTRNGAMVGVPYSRTHLKVADLPEPLRSAETWEAPNWRRYLKTIGMK